MEVCSTNSDEEQGPTLLLEHGPRTTAPRCWQRAPATMAATCSLLLAAGYLLSWPLAKGFTSHVADKVGNPLTLGRGILIAQQGSPTDPSQKLSCVFPADIMNKLDLTFQYNTDFKNGSCFMDLTPLPPGGDVFGYTFRLTFWYPDHTWYQLNWLQESDPTARRIIGYKPLDSYTAQAEFFQGSGSHAICTFKRQTTVKSESIGPVPDGQLTINGLPVELRWVHNAVPSWLRHCERKLRHCRRPGQR